MQDVGSQCSNTEGLDGSTSPIIQRKLELDKVCEVLHVTLSVLSTVLSCVVACMGHMSQFYSIVIFISPFTEVYFILNLHSTFYISLSVADITSFHPHMTQLFLWLPVKRSVSEVTLLWLQSWPVFKELHTKFWYTAAEPTS